MTNFAVAAETPAMDGRPAISRCCKNTERKRESGSSDEGRERRCGAITACYREVPAAALPVVRELQADCEAAGFPGILQIGRPGQPLLNVPPNEGRAGILLATGLNPVACLWENDRRIDSRPMVGPVDYTRLVPWRDLRHLIAALAA
jgi:repressor of nif and glnA expression